MSAEIDGDDFPLTIESREELEAVLRRFISGIDYDIHKSIEFDEETGEDNYPQTVEDFLDAVGAEWLARNE